MSSRPGKVSPGLTASSEKLVASPDFPVMPSPESVSPQSPALHRPGPILSPSRSVLLSGVPERFGQTVVLAKPRAGLALA